MEHSLAKAEAAIKKAAAVETAEVTRTVTRGVRRLLAQLGIATLTEVTLKSGRRADIMGIDENGAIVIVEVKASIADFRGDRKWISYQDYCDRLYFAVPRAFPLDILPSETGLILADGYEASLLRDAPEHKIAAARRKGVVNRFARLAAQRLHRLNDPTVDL